MEAIISEARGQNGAGGGKTSPPRTTEIGGFNTWVPGAKINPFKKRV